MERKRVATAFTIVMLLGAVLSTVGMMIASGVDQEGILYTALSTAAICFSLIAVFVPVPDPDRSNDEQNQPEAELDSSLY